MVATADLNRYRLLSALAAYAHNLFRIPDAARAAERISLDWLSQQFKAAGYRQGVAARGVNGLGSSSLTYMNDQPLVFIQQFDHPEKPAIAVAIYGTSSAEPIVPTEAPAGNLRLVLLNTNPRLPLVEVASFLDFLAGYGKTARRISALISVATPKEQPQPRGKWKLPAFPSLISAKA